MRYPPGQCTSIDFCEQLVYLVTGSSGIPRHICTPIILEAASDDTLATWGEISRHNRTVEVGHLPPQLDRHIGEALGNLFRKWGERAPNRMRLGPLGESIGPWLPTAANDYWEPSEGHLVVGTGMSESLEQTTHEFVKAHRLRVQVRA